MTETSISPTWTWADQISSWRFWGLTLSYVLTVSVANAAANVYFPLLQETMGLTYSQYSVLASSGFITAAFGFCLAWLAIKWKPVVVLVLLALLKTLGMILIVCAVAPMWLKAAGFAALGLTTGAIVLIIPAVIASGKNSAESFVISFGVVTTIGVLVGATTSVAVREIVNRLPTNSIIYFVLAPVVLGALVLLTVDPILFGAQPADRKCVVTPVAKKPLRVALLFLVPFYAIYWLYRAHGEVATLAPSSMLLSPRAALLGSIFIPFLYPIALASMMDALSRKYQAHGEVPLRSPITIFLWTLCFAPVAGAMIQSAINRAIADSAKASS